jgi:hypothetical protein
MGVIDPLPPVGILNTGHSSVGKRTLFAGSSKNTSDVKFSRVIGANDSARKSTLALGLKSDSRIRLQSKAVYALMGSLDALPLTEER